MSLDFFESKSRAGGRILFYSLGVGISLTLLLLVGFLFERYLRIVLRTPGWILFVAAILSLFLMVILTLIHWIIQGQVFYAALSAISLLSCGFIALSLGWVVSSDMSTVSRHDGFYGALYGSGLFYEVKSPGICDMGDHVCMRDIRDGSYQESQKHTVKPPDFDPLRDLRRAM